MTDQMKIEITGKREEVMAKIHDVERLAADFNSSVVSMRFQFHCDNPDCGFEFDISEDGVMSVNYCPKCGVKNQ